jgi:integrase
MRGKGESSVYKDTRGYWTAAIELPPRNGKRRRKVIRSKDKEKVLAQLDKQRFELRNNGDLPTDNMTVAQWLNYWYDRIAVNEVRPKTAENYRTIIHTHTIPEIGKTRLSKLNQTHIRQVTDAMMRPGVLPDGKPRPALSSTYALNAHRVLSTAFEAAVREDRLMRNPAKLMAAPRKAVTNLEVLDLQETLDVYTRIRDARMADDDQRHTPEFALWATTLLTGARRGEIIALQEDRVTDVLDISWQMQRLQWQHGCDRPCLERRAANCPKRRIIVPADYEYQHISGGLFLARPKSKNGWRIIPLVEPLHSIIRTHMLEHAPGEHGFVFTNQGRPIDPHEHSRNWKKLLAQTGIDKNVRLHDLRHGAIDLLTIAGVPDDVIVQIAGHASRLQTNDYRRKHDIGRMRMEMTKLGDLFPTTASLDA